MASRSSPWGYDPDLRTDALTLVLEDDDEADAVFEALQSDTARSVLSTLYKSSATVSALADQLETSQQNVGYHLDNLGAAGLVEVVGTRTSTKGIEMDVYGPSSDPLLVIVGGTDTTRDCCEAIAELADASGS